jgi:hypothetical protein
MRRLGDHARSASQPILYEIDDLANVIKVKLMTFRFAASVTPPDTNAGFAHFVIHFELVAHIH